MPRRKKQVQEIFPYAPTAIININDIYAVINYVQVSKKGCSFIASNDDATTMENLFDDCKIAFKRSSVTNGIKYLLQPPPQNEIPDEVFAIDEEYDDEILEDGQCF